MNMEKRKYDIVIFDLDGTLLDTLADLADSVNAAMKSCGFPGYSYEQVRRMVGNGIRVLIGKAVPDGEQNPDFQKAFDFFREHYAIHCMDKTGPYPGVMELLRKLKEAGIPTAIVSNKADFAVKKLNDTCFQGLVEMAVGEQERIRKKPAPDMVEMVLRRFGIPVERALYVGDSEVDILTAANCGMDAAIVTWGFRDRELLRESGAPCMADTMEELKQVIGLEA